MNFQALISTFIVYCSSKQLRPKTVLSYEQALSLFARWLQEEYGIDDATQVKEMHIRGYIVNLQQRGKYTVCSDDKSLAQNFPSRRKDYQHSISNITINNYLRNLKVFFSWLVDYEYIDRSPLTRVKLLPAQRPAKEYLEDDEVIKLIRSMNKSSFSEYRDLMVLLLMLDSGTRLGETLTLEYSQLDIKNRCLYLTADKTKSRKARTVYFSARTAKELHLWRQFRDRYCNSDFLFPVKRGGHMLKVSNYETNFAKYIKRAGIKKHISPHTMRNNFAKRCLLSGMDIYTLSRILGHSSVTITENAYLDVHDADIRKRYPKFSPINAIYSKK